MGFNTIRNNTIRKPSRTPSHFNEKWAILLKYLLQYILQHILQNLPRRLANFYSASIYLSRMLVESLLAVSANNI